MGEDLCFFLLLVPSEIPAWVMRLMCYSPWSGGSRAVLMIISHYITVPERAQSSQLFTDKAETSHTSHTPIPLLKDSNHSLALSEFITCSDFVVRVFPHGVKKNKT